MKKRNLLAVIALLLVAITGGLVANTYSRYLSSAKNTTTVNVAPWRIKVNTADIVNVSDASFETSVNWAENANVTEGYIAPAQTGTFEVEIDPTGSKVAMEYTIEIDESKLTAANKNIKLTSVKVGDTDLTKTGNVYSGEISLTEAEAGTKKNVVATVTWENEEANNAEDTKTGKAANDILLPVTVTVSQKIA